MKQYNSWDILKGMSPAFPFIIREGNELEKQITVKSKNDLLLNINHHNHWIRDACRWLIKKDTFD